MQWTIALYGHAHPRPETGVPPRHRQALDLAARTPMTIEPKATLDPDTKVPAKLGQMAHQLRIGKAPIGQKDDLAVPREQQRRPVEQGFVGVIADRGAARFEYAPHQRYSPASIEHRNPGHAVRIPQHRGVQGEIEHGLAP